MRKSIDVGAKQEKECSIYRFSTGSEVILHRQQNSSESVLHMCNSVFVHNVLLDNERSYVQAVWSNKRNVKIEPAGCLQQREQRRKCTVVRLTHCLHVEVVQRPHSVAYHGQPCIRVQRRTTDSAIQVVSTRTSDTSKHKRGVCVGTILDTCVKNKSTFWMLEYACMQEKRACICARMLCTCTRIRVCIHVCMCV